MPSALKHRMNVVIAQDFNVFIVIYCSVALKNGFWYSKVCDNGLDEHFYDGPSIFQCLYELLYRIKGAIENSFPNLRERLMFNLLQSI